MSHALICTHLDQILADNLVHRVTDETLGTLIPHIHSSVNIDTEDRGISSINQLRVLSLLGQTSGNVLTDTDHTDNVALLIPPRGGVQQNLDASPALCDERELKVGRLLTPQGLVEDGLDGDLEIVGDELLHEAVAHDLLGGVPDEAHGTLVPHVYLAIDVDTEDGGVGGIDELGILALLGDTAGNVLTDADHADDLATGITPGRGVQQDLDTSAGLGHQGKLEVGRLVATEGTVENGLDGGLIISRDEFCLWLHEKEYESRVRLTCEDKCKM